MDSLQVQNNQIKAVILKKESQSIIFRMVLTNVNLDPALLQFLIPQMPERSFMSLDVVVDHGSITYQLKPLFNLFKKLLLLQDICSQTNTCFQKDKENTSEIKSSSAKDTGVNEDKIQSLIDKSTVTKIKQETVASLESPCI